MKKIEDLIDDHYNNISAIEKIKAILVISKDLKMQDKVKSGLTLNVLAKAERYIEDLYYNSAMIEDRILKNFTE